VEHTAVVEEGASVEDIEQAALEAERMAQEAQRRAAELREKLQRARRSITPKEDSD
jgi:Mg2+ and Co2+ transporter CorA